MKTIITVFIILFFSQSMLAIEGYHKGDTVWYKFDKMLIEVASTRATRKGVPLDNDFERIKQIQKVLAELSITEPAIDERVIISFRGMGEDMFVWNYKEVELIRVKRNRKSLVVFNDGTTFEKDFGRFCIFFSFMAVETKIYVDDLNDIDFVFSEDFTNKTEQASAFLLNEFGEKYKKGIMGWLDLRGDEVKEHFQTNGNTASQDMLYLSAGIGSGWVKNTFVSDINFRMGVSFGKKGLHKNLYAIDYNMMYDFSESNDKEFFKLNHFVSLAWEHNFSNNPENDKWYGFSAGYLVKRNGDFFKENTFKLAINKKINNTFSVKPELYFNDFFKNVYPGIRFSVAF